MSAEHGRALALHVSLSAVVGLATTIVWGATGGSFWPAWVWLGLGVPVAIHAVVRWALTLDRPGLRALGITAGVSATLIVMYLAIWGLTGGGSFWPAYPDAVLGTATAVLALVVFRDRLWPTRREEELQERVGQLTRTRRGALDVQAAELRRIERDLHDGAQARLVALSMQLGRAEERLEDRPELADLVRRARGEANAAIGELRDLARGIAPPVLADRGLDAAVQALATRSAVPVEAEVALRRRPLPVVETAAYFVVAEALTNVAKHAGGAGARVVVAERGERLVVEVSDDGPGGADPAGSGLTGLRHRVEALDGTLAVASEPGLGTSVRVELPCGS